jgi:hypothetical protein
LIDEEKLLKTVAHQLRWEKRERKNDTALHCTAHVHRKEIYRYTSKRVSWLFVHWFRKGRRCKDENQATIAIEKYRFRFNCSKKRLKQIVIDV